MNNFNYSTVCTSVLNSDHKGSLLFKHDSLWLSSSKDVWHTNLQCSA